MTDVLRMEGVFISGKKLVYFFLVLFSEKNSMNPSWSGEEDRGNDRWDLHNEAAWANSSRKNDALSETPESPPIYEKAGFRDPIEYNDSQSQEPLLSSVGDVDHRSVEYFY